MTQITTTLIGHVSPVNQMPVRARPGVGHARTESKGIGVSAPGSRKLPFDRGNRACVCFCQHLQPLAAARADRRGLTDRLPLASTLDHRRLPFHTPGLVVNRVSAKAGLQLHPGAARYYDEIGTR